MKIIAISDTHGFTPKLPKGDLLLICGDFIPLNIQRNEYKSRIWMLNDFIKWLDSLKFKKVLFICGNHEVGLSHNTNWLKEHFPSKYKYTYLEDSLYEYEGIKIYGTPWCKIFYDWAFMKSDDLLKIIYSRIPEGLDILMSHDAPYQNECGFIHNSPYHTEIIDASNYILGDEIKKKKPKYSICGHIHSGNKHLTKIDDTYFCNVSYVNEEYYPEYNGLTINYGKEL